MTERNHPSCLNKKMTQMGNCLAPVFLQDMMPQRYEEQQYGQQSWKTAERPKNRNAWQLGALNRKGCKKKKRACKQDKYMSVLLAVCSLPKHCMDGCLLQGWLNAVGSSLWSLYEQHSEASNSSGEGNEGLNDFFKAWPRLEETGWLEGWAL